MDTRSSGVEQAGNLMEQIGIGRNGLMMPTAYDTAWLAQVPSESDPNVPAFPEAIAWLRRNQLPDGSWGAEIEYVHDRVISTLAAILALAKWGDDEQDSHSIDKGLTYIWKSVKRLEDEHETIGFEVILPTFLTKCQQLGYSLPIESFAPYQNMRKAKLDKIPSDLLYSRNTTVGFSLEFMGDDLDTERASAFLEDNGSVAVSPSATAYLLTKLPGCETARRYITDIVEAYRCKAPQVFPFDVFETAWVLWNLALAGFSPSDPSLASHVTNLADLWNQPTAAGLGFSSNYSNPDADDSAVAFSVLRWAGYEPDQQVFRKFERMGHFVCYPWERDGDYSLSVNIHVLDALRGIAPNWTDKIVGFLRSQRTPEGYWHDKWHISPYYTTCHAVIALTETDPYLARDAIQWIIDTQHPNGSWGYCGRTTAEETAYCLQALCAYDQRVQPVDKEILMRGGEGLLACQNEKPALWIGKCLYAPIRVIESAICSALVMTNLSLASDSQSPEQQQHDGHKQEVQPKSVNITKSNLERPH